jgi:hypothetical protein
VIDLSVEGRIILKWSSRHGMWGCWLGCLILHASGIATYSRPLATVIMWSQRMFLWVTVSFWIQSVSPTPIEGSCIEKLIVA